MVSPPPEDPSASSRHLQLLHELDAVFLDYDPDTLRPLFVSQGVEALLGCPASEWLDDPEFWVAHMHPDDRDWVLRYCRTETDRGRDHRMEYRMLARDGREVWVRDHTRAIHDANGKVVRLRGVLLDITEFKRIEATVRKSEQWYRALNEHALDIVTVLSPEVVALYQNPATERVLGFKPEELVGRCMLDLIHTDDTQAVIAAMSSVLEAPEASATVQFRFAHKAGGWRVLEAIGRNLLHDPSVKGIVVLSRDVTSRHEAEVKLQESEERYRLVVSSLTEGVALVDAEGRLCALNAAAALLFGFHETDSVGRRIAELEYEALAEDGTPIPIEQRPVFVALREGRAVLDYPLRIRSARGVERWAIANARPLFREGATQPHLAVVSFTDITEKRKLEEMLLQTQKLEAIGRLAGGIAHDFNNLLTAVRGYSDLLLETLASGDPHRAHVEQIRGAGERAALLTSQLLAFGRRQHLEPRVLDLNRVLTDLDGILRRLIGEHIELRTLPAAEQGAVRADRGQLEQIVMNLAINARDAMPDGGTLTLSTHAARLEGDESWLLLRPDAGDYVVLRVRDTGVGMDHDTLQKIFEPFFTTKPSGQGTGLGLASVYGVVQQSGGALAVRSAPGEGTTFDIYLPATALHANVESPAPPERAESQRGVERVLVVEDEPMVRALVSHVLAAQGYDVRTASNGDEALALAEQPDGIVDILISDVVMPGLNGVELARRLQARWPGLRVLLISGYSDAKLLEGAGESPGAPQLLAKPFTPADLLARVRQLLDSRAASPAPHSG